MQTIDLKMSKSLSEAFFNPRASSFFRELNRVGLLDYATLAARLGTSEGWVRRNARRTYTPRASFRMLTEIPQDCNCETSVRANRSPSERQ